MSIMKKPWLDVSWGFFVGQKYGRLRAMRRSIFPGVFLQRLAFLLGLQACVIVTYAQVTVELEPDHLGGSDTLWVDVRIRAELDTLAIPVTAYQFRVETSANLQFLGIMPPFTLSAKKGWTTGKNVQNGLVGGFSSSLDAIREIGVLIRLQFLLKGTDTSGTIELREFRLNTGKPDHFPAIPSLCFDLLDHHE